MKTEAVEEKSATEVRPIPLIHEWTNGGDKVLLVKCLGRDGKSYNGFEWPKSGKVAPLKWKRDTECETGGLFGWPWGLRIGDGKEPDACAPWLVFAANPKNVIQLPGSKCKVVPGDDGELPEVVYYGDMAGAMYTTSMGRVAFVIAGSSGSASATGMSGSASATGESGSASATGESGSASATGERGSASATGWSGSASATGWRGSASATGESGSASATGKDGIASMLGLDGQAKVGENGIVQVAYWDALSKRKRIVTGYVGEDGIQADVWYRAVDGKLAEVL